MISPEPLFGFKALPSADEILSKILLTCTDRSGINGLITRAVNTRFDLRYLLDLIKSAGLKIKSPIAATSSAA